METLELIKILNKLRLANKNKWVYYTENNIQYKAFNCWVQILRVGVSPVNHASLMNLNVKEFKAHLLNSINYK